MNLMTLIRKVLATKVITPEIDTQIRTLLWTSELSNAEFEAMHQLMEEMAQGTISHPA